MHTQIWTAQLIQPTPNLIAYAALITWPLASLYLFKTGPVSRALIWTILGGHLLLPVGTVIKFSGIPGLDKESIPSLVALVGFLLVSRRPSSANFQFGLAEVFLLALIGSPFITSEFNGDPVEVGRGLSAVVLPGVGHYDALSASVNEFIELLPFIFGRWSLRSPIGNSDVLLILTVAGIAYSFPMLFEVRMSPQLHAWIYGYFPHLFDQQVRDGGFRPVVFLGHGLLVAFFCTTSILASAALWKTGTRVARLPSAGVTVWLGGTLVLCKSLGSLLYASALVPLILFTKPRFQIRIAAALVSIALAYPMLRTMDLVPADAFLEAARFVSVDREGSLTVRFEQEKMLLAHTWERPWFGWGRFGRGRVYDEYGKDISITDGHWIVTMSTFGLFGFLAEFGLLAFSVFRSMGALRYAATTKERVNLAALALIVAVGVIDLLPNSTISPWSWLLAGALLGRSEALRSQVYRRSNAKLPALDSYPSKSLRKPESDEITVSRIGYP